MKLKGEQLAAEDSWKDIVRIHEPERLDVKGTVVARGTICRLTVNGTSKWVIARGLKKKRGVVQMDLNLSTDLDLDEEEEYDFTLTRISWVKSLWFPWKASDPIYRIPAQLALISFALGLIGLVLGVIPLIKGEKPPSPPAAPPAIQILR